MNLSSNDVHVWTFQMATAVDRACDFKRILAPEELARAERFRFDSLRNAFLVRRGALRLILARYLDRKPEELRFITGPHGKPYLDDERSELQFNRSHSGDWAALAVCRGCQLGIDLERIRPLTDLEAIAERFFCPEEASEILSFTDAQQVAAFFYCWTRKEAYIKATGDGLSAALDSFRVSVTADTATLSFSQASADTRNWTLHNLELIEGFAAALAYPDKERTLSYFPLCNVSDLLGSR